MKSTAEKQSKSVVVTSEQINEIKKYIRDNNLLYRAQIARRFHINIRTVDNILDNKRCSPETIEKVLTQIAA